MENKKKYRLYIDESGTHKFSKSEDISQRYLALVGIIISEEEIKKSIQPKIRCIRELFKFDIDETPILHREDIIASKGNFSRLNEPKLKNNFEDMFFKLVEDSEYVICCVTLDKKTHFEKYLYPRHPYHYSLHLMLERYVLFLEEVDGIGDVMAEARGKKEDNALSDSYFKFYEDGTDFTTKRTIKLRLTSSKIKIKNKKSHIEGLEFADLLSLPCKFDTLNAYSRLEKDLKENFTKKIIYKIQDKYRKNIKNTKIKGFGKKLI